MRLDAVRHLHMRGRLHILVRITKLILKVSINTACYDWALRNHGLKGHSLGLRVSTRRRETRFILALDIQPLIFTSNWAVSILDSHKCRLLIEVCSVSPHLLVLLILIVVLSVHDLLLAGRGLRKHLSNVLCVRPRVIRKGACREVIL